MEGGTKANPMNLSFHCTCCQVPGCARGAEPQTQTANRVCNFVQVRKCPVSHCHWANVEIGTLIQIQGTFI